MAGLSDYKLTEEDQKVFEMVENHECKGIPCKTCPYSLEIPLTNTGFCTLDYIYNRLICARESEG